LFEKLKWPINISVSLMPRLAQNIRICGAGMTRLGKLSRTANELMREALEKALASAKLNKEDLGKFLS